MKDLYLSENQAKALFLAMGKHLTESVQFLAEYAGEWESMSIRNNEDFNRIDPQELSLCMDWQAIIWESSELAKTAMVMEKLSKKMLTKSDSVSLNDTELTELSWHIENGGVLVDHYEYQLDLDESQKKIIPLR